MQKNLTAKTITIVVTLLVCIYGIIGLPKSKAELMANLKHNIRLGLDLSGGSHLILQVQVQDALKAEADNVIEQLRGELKPGHDRLRRPRAQ
jgi:preprotein translocase subunit SecD